MTLEEDAQKTGLDDLRSASSKLSTNTSVVAGATLIIGVLAYAADQKPDGIPWLPIQLNSLLAIVWGGPLLSGLVLWQLIRIRTLQRKYASPIISDQGLWSGLLIDSQQQFQRQARISLFILFIAILMSIFLFSSMVQLTPDWRRQQVRSQVQVKDRHLNLLEVRNDKETYFISIPNTSRSPSTRTDAKLEEELTDLRENEVWVRNSGTDLYLVRADNSLTLLESLLRGRWLLGVHVTTKAELDAELDEAKARKYRLLPARRSVDTPNSLWINGLPHILVTLILWVLAVMFFAFHSTILSLISRFRYWLKPLIAFFERHVVTPSQIQLSGEYRPQPSILPSEVVQPKKNP